MVFNHQNVAAWSPSIIALFYGLHPNHEGFAFWPLAMKSFVFWSPVVDTLRCGLQRDGGGVPGLRSDDEFRTLS